MDARLCTKLAATVIAASLAFWVNAAGADIITFDLDTGNSAIAGFTGPYAEVTINLTSPTTADIRFDSLNDGTNIFLMGDGGTAAVNVNGDYSVSGLTGSNSGTGFTTPDSTQLTCCTTGNEDGFGSFNLKITNFDGFTYSLDTLSFTLTNTTSTWADASDVLTPNANNALAGAHIFVTSFPADQSNGAKATGFAAGNCTDCGGGPPVTTIPEPETLLLTALGLLALAGVRKKRQA
jgi:hypothetical protein